MMLSKKMMCFALGVGVGIGSTYLYYTNQNTVNQKVRCLKKKLKKAENDITNVLEKLSPEEMQKYKTELSAKIKEIKDKIENLTVKDVKDSTQKTLNNIKTNINNLSSKTTSLMNKKSNN